MTRDADILFATCLLALVFLAVGLVWLLNRSRRP